MSDPDPRRMELDALLRAMAPRVYFQPGTDAGMSYPAIRYSRDAADIKYADNRTYLYKTRYTITVIDKNPDSPIPGLVKELPGISYERFYTANNLNHDVFTLYF